MILRTDSPLWPRRRGPLAIGGRGGVPLPPPRRPPPQATAANARAPSVAPPPPAAARQPTDADAATWLPADGPREGASPYAGAGNAAANLRLAMRGAVVARSSPAALPDLGLANAPQRSPLAFLPAANRAGAAVSPGAGRSSESPIRSPAQLAGFSPHAFVSRAGSRMGPDGNLVVPPPPRRPAASPAPSPAGSSRWREGAQTPGTRESPSRASSVASSLNLSSRDVLRAALRGPGGALGRRE
jgi:hypothetical protein